MVKKHVAMIPNGIIEQCFQCETIIKRFTACGLYSWNPDEVVDLYEL